MKKRSLFLETSVVGYLASRPSRDVVVASNQVLTREWWQNRREHFDIYISELVALELGAGNPESARERLAWVADLPYLDITPRATQLADRFVNGGPLPAKAIRDAVHIAVTAVHELDFLLTWNCVHIANAFMKPRLDAILREEGIRRPPL